MLRVFAIICAVVFISACAKQSTDAEVQSAIKRGDVIVEALEEYRNDNQSYPAKLNDLVPQYISVVPLAAQGEEWGYSSLDGGTRFALGYDWGPRDVAIFTNGGAGWAIDTK